MNQNDTPYHQLGGGTAIQALVERFYALMDELPEAYVIRKLHPESLEGSARKLTLYLSYWLGGPDEFTPAFGHPRMRARHLPFPIGEAERDAWLLCMAQALQETLPAGEARDALWQNLVGLADHMRNREG